MKTPHHIFTRGAHGKRAEIPENEIYLCFEHHILGVHAIGRKTFAKKYGLEKRFERAERAIYKN